MTKRAQKPHPPKRHKELAAAVMVLHERVAKLEKALKKAKPEKRPIGFEVPDVVQGEVVPMMEDD